MAFDRDGLLVARVTTTIVHKGRRYPIRKGVTVVHSDDTVVQGRERLFEPLKVTRLGPRTARWTETATAGPDERREVQLPSELGGGEVTPAETSGAEGRAGSTPAGTASSPPPADPEPRVQTLDDPYYSWSRKDLVTECRARDLPTSGNKDELIGRLKANEPDGD